MTKIQKVIQFLSVITFLFSFESAQGTIIVLNGTSTAGKSSITKEIKNCMEVSFDGVCANLVAEVVERKIETLDQKWLDLFVEHNVVSRKVTPEGTIYSFPRNNRELIGITLESMERLSEESCIPDFCPLAEEEISECLSRGNGVLITEVLRLSDLGHNVLIDNVLAEESAKEDFESAFIGKKLYSVLVYCSPGELVPRIRERNRKAAEAGSAAEKRELETPIGQFLDMYVASDDPQRNPLLDGLANPEDARISQDTVRTIFEDGVDLFGEDFDVGSLKRRAIEQWGLQSSGFVTIRPKLRHDLIVDNSPPDAVANCARQIQRLLAPEPE